MRTEKLRDGRSVPVVGQGTWRMGERAGARESEIAALKLGLDLGMTLIDTAEMYGNGGAEEVVARAIEGRRDEVFLVTKVLPSNASFDGTLRACERSLKRLRTDAVDLYLLHWESEEHPLEQTLAAFVELERAGRIKSFGVSNFDERAMARTLAHPDGARCASNQLLYNLARRGIEYQLLSDLVRRRILVMAYSPLDEAHLETGAGRDTARRRALHSVARRHGVTPGQIAIAFTIRGTHARPGSSPHARPDMQPRAQPDVWPAVVSIPKAADPEHVKQNAASAEIELGPDDLAELDAAFPPPARPAPLEMI
jgi:diketogulonate reductase-like aldo/keto reductase